MSRGTKMRNVRVDDARWAALGDIAERDGKDRSALIRDMIDQLIEGYDPDEWE